MFPRAASGFGSVVRLDGGGGNRTREPFPRRDVALCRRGHELTEANSYWRPDHSVRECRECKRLRKLGAVDIRPRDNLGAVLQERSREDSTGCRLWLGGFTLRGYGTLTWQGKTVHVHRLAYTLYVGPIPPDFHIHHVCECKACITPAHLLAISAEDHARLHHRSRGDGMCAHGHEISAENTRSYVRSDGRADLQCRVCDRDRKRREYHAQRAA